MLRRILLASAGAMALAAPALAADLLRAPPPPPPPPPPPMWTGFYVGLNAGGTWSSDNSINTTGFPVGSFPGFAPLASVSAQLATTSVAVQNSGFIGGGQWGYNYQYNNWVLGAEGDFQGIASSHPSNAPFSQATAVVFGTPLPTNQLLSASRGLDWLGTERTRVGFLIWPTFLVYGTGGLAYGQTQTNVAIGQTVEFPGFASGFSFGSSRQTLAGWTAGGGAEWLFSPNWSLKVEYLYYDLGSHTFGLSPLVNTFTFPVTIVGPSASTRFNGNIVRAGIDYHINWLPAPIVAKY